ncbi:MAG: 4Fe-4S binding protein [Bacteroidales bacterium]|jgi:polyferredoxin
MKKTRNPLKIIRLIIQIVLFTFMLILFLDFTGTLQTNFAFMARIQFVPALLSLSFIIIGLLILLTLLFGRIYCSTICPLGTLQDIFIRISNLFYKNNINRFRYKKAYNVLRYSVLGIAIVGFFMGFSVIITLLDPYGAFGRISANIFRPILISVNNVSTKLLYHTNDYVISNAVPALSSLIVAIITFVCLMVMCVVSGRLYCNTLCPVGGVLSLISRFSLFKIHFNKEKCVNCKTCKVVCKSNCIDSQNMLVDNSRCVMCLNCLGQCNSKSLKFGIDINKK